MTEETEDLLSWDRMLMDERMRDTGYDVDAFYDYNFDDYDDFDEIVYPEHAAMEPGYYEPDWEAIEREQAEFEAEEKAWHAAEEAEAERLEMLDPYRDPRMWQARCQYNFGFIVMSAIITVPGSGKVMAEKDPYRRRGHRNGDKPRERNRERRREREEWREQLLSN